MNASKITTKGQVTIPKAVRERLRLQAGDVLVYEFGDNGAGRGPKDGAV
jgi:AbrB family looped-hinge helix DNA binding protein